MASDVTLIAKELSKSPFTVTLVFFSFFGSGFYWLLNHYLFDFSNMKEVLGIDGIILLSIMISFFFFLCASLLLTISILITQGKINETVILMSSTLVILCALALNSDNPFLNINVPFAKLGLIVGIVGFFILGILLSRDS